MLALLAVGANISKQSNQAAALIVGIFFAGANLETGHETALSSEVTEKLIDLGMALVLFFSGLSVDMDTVLRYWRIVVTVGSFITLLSVGLFAFIGWAIGLCDGPSTILFFGVACSLPSKGLVTDFRVLHGADNTMHVKLTQGLLLPHDFVAVIAFSAVNAFTRSLNQPIMVPSCVNNCLECIGGHNARRFGSPPALAQRRSLGQLHHGQPHKPHTRNPLQHRLRHRNYWSPHWGKPLGKLLWKSLCILRTRSFTHRFESHPRQGFMYSQTHDSRGNLGTR